MEAKQRLENMVSQADSLFILAEPPDGVQRILKKSKRSAPGTRTKARAGAKGKRKSKETSDESEDQPLALTLKKRVRSRPAEEKVPRDNESTHEPSPKDSENAEETVS